MTPEQLEALADRVEAGDTGPELDEAIWIALGADLSATPHRWQAGIYGVSAEPWSGFYRAAPNHLTSLDAAASVMPAGWAVTVETWPGGDPEVVAIKCHQYPGNDDARRQRSPLVRSSAAKTECAARVAAGLRARAHDVRKAGGA